MQNLKLKLLGPYLLWTALTNRFSTGKFWMIVNDIHPPPPHPTPKKNKIKDDTEQQNMNHKHISWNMLYVCMFTYATGWIYTYMALSVCQIFEHDTGCMSSIWTWQCLYAQYLNMTLFVCQIFYIGWFFLCMTMIRAILDQVILSQYKCQSFHKMFAWIHKRILYLWYVPENPLEDSWYIMGRHALSNMK